MNVALLGPPGSGKGTQAVLLAARLGLHHLSTGDLLRDEARSRSELGRTASQYMDAGRLVPDEIVVEAVRRRLSTLSPNSGFVLDGFPRTLPQALAVERILQEVSRCLPQVVSIDISEEATLKRLSGRLTCPKCHAVFHAEAKPPRDDNICDNCGSQLIRRSDEDARALRERLEAYAAEVEGILSFYRERGTLSRVSGEGSIEEVSQRILAALSLDQHDNPEK